MLEVQDLVVPARRDRASFSARKGEILGFAGLIGAGRTELMEAIFGVTPALAGSMKLDGQPYMPNESTQGDRRRRVLGARRPQASWPRAADVGRAGTRRYPTYPATPPSVGSIAKPSKTSPKRV